MGDNAIDVFDNFPNLEMSSPIDVKETLVYIDGYVIHKDVPVEDTLHYFCTSCVILSTHIRSVM